MSDQTETTLVLYDRLKTTIISNDVVDKVAMRNMLGPAITDIRYGLKWYEACMRLEEEGVFLVPIRGQSGKYKVATAEEAADKVMNKARLKEMRQIDRRQEQLVNAQKHAEMGEESRRLLNAEEIVHGRFAQAARRELLRRDRKRPDGL